MNEVATGLGLVASIQGTATVATTLIVNGITMAFPWRPAWLAWLLALGFGIFFAGVASVAILDDGSVFTPKLISQLFLLGIFVGSAAAGINSTTRKADETRIVAAQEHIAKRRARIYGGKS